MRVLIVVENLPVPLDRRVWQEACALRDARHEVTVICPQMRGFTQAEEVLEGIQIFRHWISGEAGGKGGYFLEYVTALWGELHCALKAWRRTGFDVIHLCNPPDLLFLVALPFKLLAGVRLIYDVHDLWPEMFEAKFGKRGLLYWAVRLAECCTLKLADVVMATNQSVLQAVKKRGQKCDDEVFIVRTAPNQLPTTVPADPALKKGKNYLVGYIGVMGNADGVDYLIQAVEHIVKVRGRQDVQFLLMGSGPEYEELLRLREQLGMTDCIDMPGRVTNEFLFTGLQTMDLGVACDPINAYNDHCTMNKTLEYMAFSKAQVMFGTKEGRFSAGDAAHYVMENSAALLGDAMLTLLDDAPRRQRMGEIGYQRLHHELSWSQSVTELLKAYDRAMI
ncbi:MAG: glycosyltransferase family 4 protein [Verrucomicrobia bacterium]|nr:glycosyltransferase family 4 protein [Verrucomicrobiota bacterium]